VIARFKTEMFEISAMLKSEKKDHPIEHELPVNDEIKDLPKACVLRYTRDFCRSLVKSKVLAPPAISMGASVEEEQPVTFSIDAVSSS